MDSLTVEQLNALHDEHLEKYKAWHDQQDPKLDFWNDDDLAKMRAQPDWAAMLNICDELRKRNNLASFGDEPYKERHNGLVRIYPDPTSRTGLRLEDQEELRNHYAHHKAYAATMSVDQLKKRKRELYREMGKLQKDNISTLFEERELNAIKNELKGREVVGTN